MTTTAPPPPPAPPPAPPAGQPPGQPRGLQHEELVRLEHDRVWLGVCAAVGRATGTDPVLWRVAVVVLTFFGGGGVLLYLAGWAIIRDEGEDAAPVDRFLRGRRGRLSAAGVAVACLAGLAAFGLFDLITPWDGLGGPSIAPLAVVALLAFLVLRRAPVSSEPAPVVYGPVPPPPYAGPVSAGDVPPPRVRRPPVAAVTMAAAIAVAGVLAILGMSGVDGLTVPRALAGVLITLGVGIVVGARFGRQLFLITLALLTAGALNLTARIDIPWHASVGERTWTVTTGADLADDTRELGVGEGTLDLRGLVLTQDTTVHASVGIGHLVVQLPDNARVRVIGSLSVGEYDLPGDADHSSHSGDDLDFDQTFGPATGPVLTVDAELGVGNLEVRSDG